MEYTKKVLYQSNYWYNDGLGKAQIRDMSGAITSLRRSLQYNRENIAARNLLGLVFCGRGEVAEGLVEWIISKNFKPKDNVANYFIGKVQEAGSDLEAVNQAVKKFNQCLIYCNQNGEDLAIIQLKKIVITHPTFLKAYQLLALLYLHTEQYAKARQTLKAARKLDTTNEMTLRYMHEMAQLRGAKLKATRQKPEEAVTYNLGNETIIQPASSVMKEVAGRFTLINILVGVLIGAAIIWFLIVPAVNESKSNKLNRQMVEYSDQINAMKAQISAQTKALDVYRATDTESEAAAQTAASTSDSYENLMNVSNQFNSGSYSEETMAESLILVNRDALGASGQALCDQLRESIYPAACETKYSVGINALNAANYQSAIDTLNQVVIMDESYDSGGALLNLGIAYMRNGEAEEGKKRLQRVVELFPNTENATQAATELSGHAETDAEGAAADDTAADDTGDESAQ